MKGKTVTIFGATGFLGRYIVKHLAEQGATIRACCRNLDRAQFLKPLGEVGQITLMAVDLSHQQRVEAVCRDADYVINCVGLMHIRKTKNFDLIHHLAVKKLGEICWILGVEKLIHISGLGISPDSDALYARTKFLGEQALQKEFTSATILRPSVMFGPEDQFLNRFASMAKISPFVPLIGGGKTRMQPVFVNDVANAVIKTLTRDDAKGKIYELGGPKVYTFKELMEYMLKEIKRKRRLISIPRWLMLIWSYILQWFPGPPVTPDQMRMIKYDSVVSKDALTFKDLDIEPTPLELIAPTYLSRYSPATRAIPERDRNNSWRHP